MNHRSQSFGLTNSIIKIGGKNAKIVKHMMMSKIKVPTMGDYV